MVIYKYHLSTKQYHELVAACIVTVINNASASGKQVIFSSGIAWYYGLCHTNLQFHCIFRHGAHDL